MNICKDCKHLGSYLDVNGWGMNITVFYKNSCTRTGNINLVNGEAITLISPYLEREDYPNRCGSNGRYWESK